MGERPVTTSQGYECIWRQYRTDPPLLSFRKASQTATANFRSPSMVANSAKRRCCKMGAGVGPFEAMTAL